MISERAFGLGVRGGLLGLLTRVLGRLGLRAGSVDPSQFSFEAGDRVLTDLLLAFSL